MIDSNTWRQISVSIWNTTTYHQLACAVRDFVPGSVQCYVQFIRSKLTRFVLIERL